jgi:hypothetical protein
MERRLIFRSHYGEDTLQVTYLSSRVYFSIFGFCATFTFQYCSLEVTDVSKMYAKAVM